MLDKKHSLNLSHFFHRNIILREKANIDDGIGVPNWTLVLTLAFSWLVISSVVFRGIKSSGKASYFLAIFPYVVLVILLIRSLTLPGAFDGVLFFLKPQWDKLLDGNVWYAAVTQVFFSLSICYGSIIMYSSFNRFRHNIRRYVADLFTDIYMLKIITSSTTATESIQLLVCS